MEKIKIRLSKINIIKEVLGILTQAEIPRKIIFSCKGNIPLLADTRALKRIKEVAEKNDKEVEFISSQKFIRDILKNADFNVYSKCPADYEDLEEKPLEDVYVPQKLPPKNKPSYKNPAKNEETAENPAKNEEVLEKPFEKHKIHNPGRKKTSRSKIFFILLLILGLLGGILLWITPHARIVVKPKLSPIPVIQNVLITLPDAEIDEADEELPKVAGVFISSQIEGKESFTASGRRYDIENAHGKITLFNETNKPKFLVPSRLSTKDGLIFRFQKKVTIPAKKGDKPGEKVVEIIADKVDENGFPIGYRGNIPAGTELFFPALRPELRELYYAKANKGPLVGGSTLTHYIVDETDEEKSAKLLEEVLQTKAVENLKKENQARSRREGKKFVLLENKDLLVNNFTDFVFPKELIGKESETFQVAGKLEVSGIVFDQEVVKKYLLKKLNDVIDSRQQLIQLDENSIEYNLLDKENFAEKRYIKVSVKAVGVKSIDFTINTKDSLEWRNNLKKQIMGKTAEEARSILINVPEIEQVLKIDISPFWSNRIPNILNRIKFEVNKMLD